MRISASADVVGVGDTLHVQLVATSSDLLPSDPKLPSVAGLVVRGQSESPSQTHMFINGASSSRYSLHGRLVARGSTSGHLSHRAGNRRRRRRARASATFSVKVVPAGQAPAPRPSTPAFPQNPFGSSPFDPWKNFLFGTPGLESEPTPESPPVAVNPKLSLEAPRGPDYFVAPASTRRRPSSVSRSRSQSMNTGTPQLPTSTWVRSTRHPPPTS